MGYAITLGFVVVVCIGVTYYVEFKCHHEYGPASFGKRYCFKCGKTKKVK